MLRPGDDRAPAGPVYAMGSGLAGHPSEATNLHVTAGDLAVGSCEPELNGTASWPTIGRTGDATGEAEPSIGSLPGEVAEGLSGRIGEVGNPGDCSCFLALEGPPSWGVSMGRTGDASSKAEHNGVVSVP